MNNSVIFLTKQYKWHTIFTRRAVQAASSENTIVKSYREVPGPKPWPLIGNSLIFLQIIVGYSNFVEILKNLYKSHGKIACLRSLVFQKDIVLLTDLDEIEKFYRLQEPMPYRGVIKCLEDYRIKHRAEFYADFPGLSTCGGPKWQEARHLVNQAFLKPEIVKKYVQKVDDISREMVERMYILRDEKDELPEDFGFELKKYALEVTVMICLDKRMGCISSEETETSKDGSKLIRATTDIFENIISLDFSIFPHRYFTTPTWRKFCRDLDLIYRLLKNYIEEAKIAAQYRQTKNPEKSILERIMDKTDNENIICTLIVDMILGGVETSGSAVGILLYYLAVNEEKQRNLFEEIKNDLPAESSEPLTADHLSKLKYLKACITEALRLATTAFANTRILKDDTILCDYLIPKGTTVIANYMVFSRMEKYFHEPDMFIPERWIKGHPLYHQNFHPFALLPFGFGVRKCIGKRFAEIELMTLISRIIRKFHVEYHYDMVFTTELLMKPATPLKFKLVER